MALIAKMKTLKDKINEKKTLEEIDEVIEKITEPKKKIISKKK